MGATETTATGSTARTGAAASSGKRAGTFLFLDSVVAREPGAYRLENRWRLRGDVSLRGNTVTVRQGDPSLFIRSADDAARALGIVPDSVYYSHWDYPYGH